MDDQNEVSAKYLPAAVTAGEIPPFVGDWDLKSRLDLEDRDGMLRRFDRNSSLQAKAVAFTMVLIVFLLLVRYWLHPDDVGAWYFCQWLVAGFLLPFLGARLVVRHFRKLAPLLAGFALLITILEYSDGFGWRGPESWVSPLILMSGVFCGCHWLYLTDKSTTRPKQAMSCSEFAALARRRGGIS